MVRCDNASVVEEQHTNAEECLIGIARISMDNVHERFVSDQDMQRKLLCGHLHIGKGEQHGRNNACLADYLLQLLMREHVIDTPVFDSAASENKWRCNACLAVRAHLCNHTDVNSQPRQRDNYSAVMQGASAEEHALAYLEHHRHGIEMIVLFCS